VDDEDDVVGAGAGDSELVVGAGADDSELDCW